MMSEPYPLPPDRTPHPWQALADERDTLAARCADLEGENLRLRNQLDLALAHRTVLAGHVVSESLRVKT